MTTTATTIRANLTTDHTSVNWTIATTPPLRSLDGRETYASRLEAWRVLLVACLQAGVGTVYRTVDSLDGRFLDVKDEARADKFVSKNWARYLVDAPA